MNTKAGMKGGDLAAMSSGRRKVGHVVQWRIANRSAS